MRVDTIHWIFVIRHSSFVTRHSTGAEVTQAVLEDCEGRHGRSLGSQYPWAQAQYLISCSFGGDDLLGVPASFGADAHDYTRRGECFAGQTGRGPLIKQEAGCILE